MIWNIDVGMVLAQKALRGENVGVDRRASFRVLARVQAESVACC